MTTLRSRLVRANYWLECGQRCGVPGAPAGETFNFGDVTVNFTKMEVTRVGFWVGVTAQEFQDPQVYVRI